MCMMIMIEQVYLKFCTQVKLHREIFKFKDGGQTAMDWAFEMPQKVKHMPEAQKKKLINRLQTNENGFVGEELDDELKNKVKPILVIFLGMCSDETEIYAQNIVRDAANQGYLCVIIQQRGASGIELTSPMTYGIGQYWDVTEAIDHIHE